MAILPVHSIYPAIEAAFALQLSFVCLVTLGYTGVCRIFGVRGMPNANAFSIPGVSALIYVAIALSILGLAASTYDKVYVQQIDFSEGVAFAREEWRRAGEDREGQVSSIFSVLGYLFGSMYYVAAVLAITQTRTLSTRKRWYTVLACFVLVIANSVITGGRSSVLLLGAFAVAAFSARSGLALKTLFVSKTKRRLALGLIVLGGLYIIYIFLARADAQGIPVLRYALQLLPFLGVDANESFSRWANGGFFESVVTVFVLALTYITHSFAIVAAIIDAPDEDKRLIFAHIATLLYRVGLGVKPDVDWYLVGRFPSVPGALLYQYGGFGFSVTSFFFGVLSGASRVWTARKPSRLMPLGTYVMSGSILLLTPALFAGDFLSFPFVVGSFLMLSVLGRLLERRGWQRKDRSVPIVHLSASGRRNAYRIS